MTTTPRIRRMQARRNLRDLKTTLSDNYAVNQTTRTAAAFGRGYVQINGQLYPGALDGPAGEVINVGRPAAAEYAPKTGAGVVVVNGNVNGGGTSTVVSAAGGSVNGVVSWLNLNFDGSNITHIQTRRLGDLQGLGEDVLLQYMHKDDARVVTAQHRFAPTLTRAPFAVEAGAIGQLVTGLNAEKVGGYTHDVFMRWSAIRDLAMNAFSITNANNVTTQGLRVTSIADTALHVGNTATDSTSRGYVRIGSTGWFDSGTSLATYREYDRPLNIRGNQLQSHELDQAHWLGRATIGHVGYDGYAGIRHRQLSGVGNYLAMQDAAGRAFFNAASGLTMHLRVANNEKLVLNNTSLTVHPSVNIATNNYASQVTGWRLTYSGELDVRYLYTDELHAKVFIADLEQALAGGQIISKSVAMLAQDFTAPSPVTAATLRVRDLPSAPGMRVFEVNDVIRIRKFSRSDGSLTIADCWGTVANHVNGNDGTQYWEFSRSPSPNAGSMTAGTVVAADSIVLDYGKSGNGFHEVNAIDGRYAANSPYNQLVTWTNHPATGQTVRVRTGNLTGLGYANEYGIYMQGVNGLQYIKASNAGLLLRRVDIKAYNNEISQTVDLSSSDGSLRLGTDIAADVTTSFEFLGATGSLRIGRVGLPGMANLYWSGNTLQLRQNATPVITLDANGNSYFSGVMTIGNSGEIRQGEGSLTGNNFTGLRIWRSGDVGLIGGYNANVIQWQASTDGRLYAGANNVALSADGIDLQHDGVTENYSRTIAWWGTLSNRTGNNPRASVRGYSDTAVYNTETLELRARGSGARNNSTVRMLAMTNAGAAYRFDLFSDGTAISNAGLAVVPDPTASGATTGLVPGQLRSHTLALRLAAAPSLISNHVVVYPDLADGYLKALFLNGNKITIAVSDASTVFTTLGLQSGWSHWGAPYQELDYRVLNDGSVQLQGLVKATSSTPNSVIAILPVGVRPPKREIIDCMSINGNGNTQASRRVDVDTNGEILPSGWTPGLNDWIMIRVRFWRG